MAYRVERFSHSFRQTPSAPRQLVWETELTETFKGLAIAAAQTFDFYNPDVVYRVVDVWDGKVVYQTKDLS